MDRDTTPYPGAIALATGELMIAGKRAVEALAPGSGPAVAAAAVLVAIRPLWHRVMPEAARDVMVAAAQLACQNGPAGRPAGLVEEYGPGPLDAATGMLEMTAEHEAASWPEPQPGRTSPPLAFASTGAFDRDEDDATLTSLAALLAVAHLRLAERDALDDAELADVQAAEPGPRED